VRAIYHRRVQYKVIASCQGTFGRVLQERDCDGRVFARKYLKTTFSNEKQKRVDDMYRSEVAILEQIKSVYGTGQEHVITMIRADLAHKPPYIDFEWMEGNLYQLIQENKELSENKALELVYQIAIGLQFLHNFEIIHRDLKPENILYSPTKAGNHFLKIADFGAATHYPPRNTNVTTPPYAAPEMVSTKYGYGVDVWALGCILFEMCTGKMVFKDETSRTVSIKRNEMVKKKTPHNLTPQVWQLIKNMLSDQENRISVQTLILSELRALKIDLYN
jgi:fused-like protein